MNDLIFQRLPSNQPVPVKGRDIHFFAIYTIRHLTY